MNNEMQIDLDYFFHQIAQICEARDCLSATIYENSIFVSGGYTGDSVATDIVEVYDEIRNEWHRQPAMSNPTGGGILFVCKIARHSCSPRDRM